MTPRVVVPLLAAAALAVPGPAATAADCVTWTDPRGDSAGGHAATAPATNHNDLDIVGAAVGTSGGTVTMQVRLADLNATGANTLPGDRFVMRHVVNAKIVQLTATRDAATKTVGWTVDGAAKTPLPVVTYDPTAETVTAELPLADYLAATGAAPGDRLRALYAESRAALVQPAPVGTTSALWDSTTAPDWYAHRLGTPCAAAPPDPGVALPVADCNVLTDPKTDGKIAPPVVTVSGAESPENDPDLDITGVTAQTTEDELRLYVRVDKLAALPARGNGHNFEVGFTAPGGRVISVDAAELDAVTSVPFTGRARVFVGTTDRTNNIPARARFDRAKSIVMFALDRASVAAMGGAPIPDGADLTSVYAESRAVVGGLFFPADEAPNTVSDTVVYDVGDNRCFPPPPAVLSLLSAATVQYGDAGAVTAKLADATGAPLPGRTVRFALGGDAVSAPAGPDGVARDRLRTSRTAGTYAVTVSFAGDATAGAVSATTPLTVVSEVTRLTLSVAKNRSQRTVTATLKDDDGTPVAGQQVRWLVNGRAAGTGTTDAAGRVVLRTAKPTQTVVAEYAGATGRYVGSRATARV